MHLFCLEHCPPAKEHNAQCSQKDLVTQSLFGREFKQPPKETLEKVPDILLSGHHAEIEKWRQEHKK